MRDSVPADKQHMRWRQSLVSYQPPPHNWQYAPTSKTAHTELTKQILSSPGTKCHTLWHKSIDGV